MGYLKYSQYVYILFAGYFVYDGIVKLNDESGIMGSIISFGIAGMAVFMFFFRRRFARKFDNRDNKK